MASNTSTDYKPPPYDTESVNKEVPQSGAGGTTLNPPPPVNYFVVDVAIRVLLFAAAVTSVVVTVTSKQTIAIFGLPGMPPSTIDAKFNQSPAFIYFVAALSVTGLYSLITALASISAILKPDLSLKFLLHLAFWDVLILGLVASATGTAGGIAYTGLKGNEHVHWNKVCDAFDTFCQHIGAAIVVSLFASVLLVLLVWLSIFSIRTRIPN